MNREIEKKQISRDEAFEAIGRLIDSMTDGLMDDLEPEVEEAIDLVTDWMNQEDGGSRCKVILDRLPPGSCGGH